MPTTGTRIENGATVLDGWRLISAVAGCPHVRPEDLVDQEWITVRQGFPVALVLAAVAARSGTAPRITHRINDFSVVEALVAAGHGVSLLPRYSAGGHPASGCCRSAGCAPAGGWTRSCAATTPSGWWCGGCSPSS